jgi:hypothetical protein
MDYGTAKTLSLVGLIFIGIQMGMGVLVSLLLLMQFLVLGVLVADGGDAGGMLCLVILLSIPLLLLIIPVISFILARRLHKKINTMSLEERDRSRLIALIVLSFFGGGGIVPAVMYILIIASWDEITKTHFRPVY